MRTVYQFLTKKSRYSNINAYEEMLAYKFNLRDIERGFFVWDCIGAKRLVYH